MKRRLRGFAGTLEQADRGLLLAVGVLLFIGSIIVFGAGSHSVLSVGSPLGPWFVFAKHLVMVVVGLVVMLVLMHFDHRRYRSPLLNTSALVVTYALVAVTLVTARTDANGGQIINRWINIGGYTIQPVEFAKIALVIFLAERLTRVRRGAVLPPRQLVLALVLGPLPLLMLLAAQPNYGNAMVTLGVTLVVLFATGVSDRWLKRLAVASPALAVLGYVFISKINKRFGEVWTGWNGGSYGYQVDQSLIGLGAGGLTGLGPGQSQNKFSFLPESHTDFAFSVLGEELGLLGTLLVISMVVLIAWRGYGIASRASTGFGRALAAGLTTALTIYGVVNIGMVTGIFPVVGVPLPFVSYGGTAMVTALASVGILLNIDRQSRSYHQWRHRWDRSPAP